MISKLVKVACAIIRDRRLKPVFPSFYRMEGYPDLIPKTRQGEYIAWFGSKEEKNLLCLASKDRKGFEKAMQKAIEIYSKKECQ